MTLSTNDSPSSLLLGPDIWPWYFSLTTVGDEGIPTLRRSTISSRPSSAKPLQNVRSASSYLGETLVHVYTNDKVNVRLAKNPLRYFDRVSSAAAMVTPDLSMYRVLPKSMRVFHTIVNRGVGAVLQTRGVEVIPNVAWSCPQDYDFCFLGLESRSAVSISSHGRLRDAEDRYYFEHGVAEMIDHLEPTVVVLYGASTREVDRSLKRVGEVWQYPCYQSQLKVANG